MAVPADAEIKASLDRAVKRGLLTQDAADSIGAWFSAKAQRHRDRAQLEQAWKAADSIAEVDPAAAGRMRNKVIAQAKAAGIPWP